jgi:hypothetical protein
MAGRAFNEKLGVSLYNLTNDGRVLLVMSQWLCRKHVKVEPELWYYWADRIGILVWQVTPGPRKQFWGLIHLEPTGLEIYGHVLFWFFFNQAYLLEPKIDTWSDFGFDQEFADIFNIFIILHWIR